MRWLRNARAKAHALWSSFERYCDDRPGSVALFVAVAIIPLIGALGLATDVARGYLVKSRLQHAVDAAALAGGKDVASPTRDTDVAKFFTANFPAGYMSATLAPLVITPSADGTALFVSATATVPTTFMRIFGDDELTVSAEAEATRSFSALDVVLAMDVSGSMGSPSSKIQAARDAAADLVDSLFAGRSESPTLTVGGVTYDLLNIGLVPWNQAVNVTRNGEAFANVTTRPVASFVNPLTGVTQSVLYYANNSPVPLLNNPLAYGDSGWSGAAYARYVDDGNNGNDADLVLGQVQWGGKDWVGFEAAQDRASAPRSGTWPSGSGYYCTGWGCGWNGGAWQGYERQCYSVYWQFAGLNSNTYPTEVPDRPSYTASNPGYDYDQSENNSFECVAAPSRGITALTPRRDTIRTAVYELSAGGGTVIANGLYWAWEVLVPGGPYAEAVDSPPYPRAQAIVLMTDGKNDAWFGDAYKMVFGRNFTAGTNTLHGMLPAPAPSGTRNNLDGRLIAMAAAIKEQGIKIYVVKYAFNDAATETLLKQVASGPTAPFYFNADDAAQLQTAFAQIAADLSYLRLVR